MEEALTIRITLLSENYPPITGGVENHVKNEAELLSSRGHEVKVVTISEGRNTSINTESGVEVHRVTKMDFLTWGSGDGGLCSIHQYRHPMSDIAGSLVGGPKAKRIHGIYPPKSRFDSVKKYLYDLFGSRTLNGFDLITSLSKTQKRQLEEIGVKSEKIEIMPNAINAKKWLEDLEGVEGNFKEKYGVDTNHFGIIVGRLDWNKGIEDCVKALKYIKEENLDFTCVVIGPDPNNMKNGFRQISKKLGVDDHLVFTDKIPFEDLVLAYKEANLLLVPSFYEGFPTVVMEGMLSKTPVIATPDGGTKHLVKEGKTGYLCEYGNPKSIYEKVKHVIELGKDEEMTERAYSLIENEYTWTNIVGKLEKAYLKIMNDLDS